MTSALAHAVVLHAETKDGEVRRRKDGDVGARGRASARPFDVLKQVFSECPSFDEIVPALLMEGGDR